MGVTTTIKIICDYPECKGGQNGPSEIKWINEEIKAGKQAPPEASEVISFDLNGVKLAFCGRLHTSAFFLPPGFEIKAKKVVEFQNNGNFTELKQSEES